MSAIFGDSSSWLVWPNQAGIDADGPDFVFQGPPNNPPPDIGDVFRPRVFSFSPAHPNGRAALVLLEEQRFDVIL